MFKVNVSQLTKILDVSQYSLYPNLKMLKNNKNGAYKINIDEYFLECKVSNFLFDFEKENSSFSKRLIPNNDTFSINLTAKQVKSILNINDYQLSTLRKNNSLTYIRKNKTRYIYDINSLAEYIQNKSLDIELLIYSFDKQFYKPIELITILSKHNIRISLKSIYRYIYEYNKIPCIKVSGNLRIPIREFNELVLSNLEMFSYHRKSDS
ncbi:hypothetical protein [Clostridium akagii]|uniref:hypothetical protein n=1 Tax=Clostridium akagii TaxID=91623 RepID=UPI00047962C9|nr:hypothetical protein [Clostridium akagii]